MVSDPPRIPLPEFPDDFPSAAARAELARRWNEHPGMRHLGVRVDLSTPGTVRLDVDPIQPYHRGGAGTDAVNGAIISGMFDLATGLTAYLHASGRQIAVAQLNVQFLHPVTGARFHVVGRPNRSGRTLIFTSAELFDGRDERCALANGIVVVTGDPGRADPVAF